MTKRSLDASPMRAHWLMDKAPIVDKYTKRLDAAQNAAKDLNDPRLSLNDFDKAFLAVMYDNVDGELRKLQQMRNMSDRTYSETVGPFKKHAFNIITALYTTFDIKDLISWQPMSQKLGAIYRMIIKYATDKGQITAGDAMFSSTDIATKARYYSSEVVKDEDLTFTFSTDSTAALAYFPVFKPENISLLIAGAIGGDGTYTYLQTTAGIFDLQIDGGASKVGSIDPVTGVVTLDAVNASAATTARITYRWNSQKFSTTRPIPKVTVGVTEDIVTAERRNLLLDIMLDTSYDYSKQFGASLNSEMETAVVQFLQNEMSFRILGEMFDGADGNQGDTFVFYATPVAGITKEDNLQEFYSLLSEMNQKIRNNIGRGWGTKVVVGPDLLAQLDILDRTRFKRGTVPASDGPYYAGKLNDKYDIYYNPDLGDDEFFVTFKGTSWWEAPYYVGSYLPLMNSDYLLYPDFHAEQGYLALESYKLEYPKGIVKGTVAPGAKPE